VASLLSVVSIGGWSAHLQYNGEVGGSEVALNTRGVCGFVCSYGHLSTSELQSDKVICLASEIPALCVPMR
jgi:hypothetical protein